MRCRRIAGDDSPPCRRRAPMTLGTAPVLKADAAATSAPRRRTSWGRSRQRERTSRLLLSRRRRRLRRASGRCGLPSDGRGRRAGDRGGCARRLRAVWRRRRVGANAWRARASMVVGSTLTCVCDRRAALDRLRRAHRPRRLRRGPAVYADGGRLHWGGGRRHRQGGAPTRAPRQRRVLPRHVRHGGHQLAGGAAAPADRPPCRSATVSRRRC